MCSKELRPPSADADLTIAAGDQGNKWNNCIGVTPTAPAVVALGWRFGTFVSADAGGSWKRIGESPHLHSDVHMVQITPRVGEDAHDLWIASDGGLARVDLDTWLATDNVDAQSNYNRQLPIIQCYATYVMRQFWGTLSGSTVFPSDGFVATGVQDNANLYTDLSAGPAPWRKIDGGDGGWVAFLEDGGLLHRDKDSSVSSALRDLSGPFLVDKGVIPLLPAIPDVPPGLSSATFGDAVRHPTFRGPSGQHMVAVGASGSNVYGLYLEPGSATGYHWKLIATLPSGLASGCLASFSGHTIFAACGPRIFVIDSKTAFTLELPVKLPRLSPSKPQKGGTVVRIVCDKDKTFAVMNDTSEGNHYVIRLDGLVWGVPGVVTPVNSPIFGFEAARNGEGRTYLFAATGSRVWASEDESRTWLDVSGVLPERPHNAELRLVTKERDSWLYLSTHGRSVWRAPLFGFA
jgi:hypothetical protein